MITGSDEETEKTECLYIAGKNANQYSHYGKQYGDFSQIETELPYDPEIPLLDISPKN
jgi:hypothetical protein